MNEGDRSRQDILDRQHMTELAVGTINTLQDVGFTDQINVLCERVFRLPTERLFDSSLTQQSNGIWVLSYKPMVELLLLHLRDVAKSNISENSKKEKFCWTLIIAGF